MSPRSTASLVSKARHVWSTFFRKGETPRELQERNDLYMSILSLKHRDLRIEKFGHLDGIKESHHQVEDLVDEAVADMEDEMIAHKKSVVRLRYDQQNILAPQLTNTFQAFQGVDKNLPASASKEEILDLSEEDKAAFKSILLNQYDQVLSSLGETDSTGTDDVDARLKPYLTTKRSALETILSFNGWLSEEFASDLSTDTPENLGFDEMQRKSDAFGCHIDSENDDMEKAMRHHQMINIARAALIKENLGFSVVALRSTIKDAGRGVFIDGEARAGSLVAFFPGQIWPKEHLANNVLDSSLFRSDPKLQLSMRYDDILVDARKAPYTVLNGEKSNPFAVAHIANHVKQGGKANCRTVAVNFTEKLSLKKAGLLRYVPNKYARLPMMVGQAALDREHITMHGFALLAARDISNEELTYDYRLSPGPEGSYPDWYFPCDVEATKNRWWQEKL